MDERQRRKHELMMVRGTAVPVRVTTLSGKSTTGTVRVEYWDQKGRTKRAFRFLGIFWGIALCCVLIPLAHFILVPGFLLAGPIVAYVVYCQSSAILGGESVCPECGAFLPIIGASNRWPLSDLCSQCQNGVTVEKA